MKTNLQQRIDDILDLYFSRISDGSISPRMETSIRHWFGENVNVREKYAALEKIFENWVVYNDKPSREAIISCMNTMRRLDLPVNENVRHIAKRFVRKARLRQIVMRVAAAVIPTLVVTGVLWHYSNTSDMIVETVPAGMSVRQLQLGDGTDVWMRAGSRLEYPARFGRQRNVDVSGEVFFDVAENGGGTFVVDAGELKIRVTGTKFNCVVRDGEYATVTLHEGNVKVKAGKDWTNMVEGEQFRYDSATGKGTTSKVDLDTDDWRTGEMNFVDSTLDEIFDRISEMYNVAFEFNVNFSGERYSISFFSNEELSVVLSVLVAVSDEFEFEITPGKVMINKKSSI